MYNRARKHASLSRTNMEYINTSSSFYGIVLKQGFMSPDLFRQTWWLIALIFSNVTNKTAQVLDVFQIPLRMDRGVGYNLSNHRTQDARQWCQREQTTYSFNYLQLAICSGQGSGGSGACTGNVEHRARIQSGWDTSSSQGTTTFFSNANIIQRHL